ncbi:NEDD8-activating enzyme E1 regulatory subunit [Verticillium dahliae VDG1]|nr:NEDD8-activating enzyme E1 regulatory subunit [Verticillium dahliae VDG1]
MASVCLRSSRARPALRSATTPAIRPRLPNHFARRNASTSSGSNAGSNAKIFIYSGALAGSLYISYLYATDTRASLHRWLVPPMMRLLFPDAEDAHHAGTSALQTLYALGLHPRERDTALATDPALSVEVFGTQLANPIGISAGLDKHAEIPDALFALGPGLVEVGGCTPFPQDGNPKPRVFRVPILDGMINRYGLNSHGADAMARRLRERLRTRARDLGVTERDLLDGVTGLPPGSLEEGRLLAVQIAKNKATDERDVNAAVEPLTRVLSAVVDEASRTDRRVKPKVMVKVSPDEEEDTQMEGIVQAVCESGVDGVIAAAMTGVLGAKGAGSQQKVIFATGGVTNGKQALEMLNAGASVAMVYTGLTYGGSGTITRIKKELKDSL